MDSRYKFVGFGGQEGIRAARHFGNSPEFRIDLQAHYDLDVARQAAQSRIEEEVSPRAA